MKHGSAELIVVLGIVGVVVMVAAPTVNRKAMSLTVTVGELMGDLRLARADATGRGVHFRVTLSSATTYRIERLEDSNNDGVWAVDGGYTPRTVTLPSSMSVTTGVGAVIEFSARGIRVPNADGTPASLITLVLYDAKTTQSKTIKVWPSGQIEES
jgi:Tfp pilus assembly protein FimT